MNIQELIDLGLDISIVSEKSCPDEGKIPSENNPIVRHNFQNIEVNSICNCTLCLITLVKLPFICVKVGIYPFPLIIDLSKQ